MSLTKIINDGDELVFDISNVDRHARKQISLILVKRARPANILVIRADRSIPIQHIRQNQQEGPVEGLPTYQCFKQVQAAKITKIVPLDQDAGISQAPRTALFFDNENIVVTEEWMDRFKPEVGGYYVQYEDGYSSFSPAKAFEAGYVRV